VQEELSVFKAIATQDGSSTFYSEQFGEWFHSREGARNEAQKTYVETARIRERSQKPQLHILDVCYGLGYNSAAALEATFAAGAFNRECPCELEIKGLEIDIEVPRSAIAQGLTQHYRPDVQQILQALAQSNHFKQDSICADLLIGDARQQIQKLIEQNWQADVIFLDPFSPPHCPQLWTIEFLALVAQCLKPKHSIITTYSCAAAVRTALQSCGLQIGSVQAGGRRWPGTIATQPSTDPQTLPKLSQQEPEHLLTRAAVPYRDPTLQDTAQQILDRRAQEQKESNLLPTGPWRRRWKEKSQHSKNNL